MAERINAQYKPAEMVAAIETLKTNPNIKLSEREALDIIKGLYVHGFRIVKAFEPDPPKC